MIPLVRFRWVMAFPHLHPFWPAIFLKHRIFNNFIVENVLVGTHAMPVPFPGSAAKKTITSVPRGPVPERLPPEH
jgi:hypothetical protein